MARVTRNRVLPGKAKDVAKESAKAVDKALNK